MLPVPVQVLPYFGHKWAQAAWHRETIEYYFKNRIKEFREPYAGSASTFFNLAPFATEGLNDINPSTVNAFKVIQKMPQQLLEQLDKFPARPEKEELAVMWQLAKDCEQEKEPHNKVFWAAAYLWCGHYEECGAGGRWCSGLSRNVGTRYWEPPNWKRILEFANERLKNVEVSQEDAIAYIRRHNKPNVLFYVDPPYLFSSRGSKDDRHPNPKTPRRQYRFELTLDEHQRLLSVLNGLRAGVVLSGYDSRLYRDELTKDRGWHYLRSPSGYAPKERLWVKI